MPVSKGVSTTSRNSVYPAISRNDNHLSKASSRPALNGAPLWRGIIAPRGDDEPMTRDHRAKKIRRLRTVGTTI
jgi:hypothetical protein